MSDVVTLCEALKLQYAYLYQKHQNGKDKHMHFQLHWYQECSELLLETLQRPCLQHKESTSAWFDFRNQRLQQFSIDHCISVLLSLQGAVYTYFNGKIVSEVKKADAHDQESDPSRTPLMITEESEDVYYRFGGAALKEMLHNRYKQIHTTPLDKRSQICVEISVLKSMLCSDKSIIPPSLKYRDRGHMYFPSQNIIPFIKAVDDLVRQIANNDGMKKHGKTIIEVTSQHVKSDPNLKKQFEQALLLSFDTLDPIKYAVTTVYTKFLRKICNTRLAEFMDCFQQIQASQNGLATLSGQNFRDTLLSQHVNLKSHTVQ